MLEELEKMAWQSDFMIHVLVIEMIFFSDKKHFCFWIWGIQHNAGILQTSKCSKSNFNIIGHDFSFLAGAQQRSVSEHPWTDTNKTRGKTTKHLTAFFFDIIHLRTPKLWKMKVLNPQYMGYNPKNEGFGFPWHGLTPNKTQKERPGPSLFLKTGSLPPCVSVPAIRRAPTKSSVARNVCGSCNVRLFAVC